MSIPQSALEVEKTLKKLGSKTKADNSAWFFKTGIGQYGYGDVFLGVTNPEQRKVSKQFKYLPLSEIQKLLDNKFHECRLTGLLILVEQNKKAEDKQKSQNFKFYLKNTKRINNWDLVDLSARQIVGEYLIDRDRNILYKLSKSKLLWERRIAIIATQAFIARNDFEDTLRLAEIYLDDKEDLMHKATGWMLREIGKRDKGVLVRFLDRHVTQMPRTALRYAIEHFPETQRQKYLKAK